MNRGERRLAATIVAGVVVVVAVVVSLVWVLARPGAVSREHKERQCHAVGMHYWVDRDVCVSYVPLPVST